MMELRRDWPVLTHYDADHLRRIAMPLGGIGTGTISLGGRGDLRDWEIVNRPAKGFTPDRCFFTLYAKPAGRDAVTRAIEGQIPPEDYEGAGGCRIQNHGLPRFRHSSFHAAYPLAQLVLSDPDFPADVRLEAFNPLVPTDPDRSGIPLAVLRFTVRNRTDQPTAASVCGTMRNFIGTDGRSGSSKQNRNRFRSSPRLQGLFMTSDGVDPCAEQYGTLALTVVGASDVTHRTAWESGGWETPLLDFWDDLSGDGKLEDRDAAGQDAPIGSLAASIELPAYGSEAVTFLITWHFPNRQTWTPAKKEQVACCSSERVGNYYTTRFRDAWDVAERAAAALPNLEAETVAFVKSFCESDLPQTVKEAALNNLSTLRSQTCFRTEDGRFYGWEGCSDNAGCCHGSCTHVWNYEQATAFLFGSLARSMREVEFGHATAENGLMSFRVNLPLMRGKEFGKAAADGQMGCLMKLYRDWKLSGDDDFLRSLWPNARKALAFCWTLGGWDADKDGVMEGCQHNTMDVEYYGPNGQMSSWYLGALRASEEMARAIGDRDFAETCHGLFDRGRAWVDTNLFNGEYYEQEVRPSDASRIAEGLRIGAGARAPEEPDYQLGKACLVDQLVGQYMAHICGLGYLLDPGHIRTALESIMEHNFRGFHGHFNNMRSFVLNDEQGLLMATYPLGGRPKRPFPYFAEVMTGFEYTAAVHMFYEGLMVDGLRVISAIRDRYDGRRRSPWDEAECGHHYARAMASWAAVVALTGFDYCGLKGDMKLAARDGLHFWSNGYAWGTCRLASSENSTSIELHVKGGLLNLRRFELRGVGSSDLGGKRILASGDILRLEVPR